MPVYEALEDVVTDVREEYEYEPLLLDDGVGDVEEVEPVDEDDEPG